MNPKPSTASAFKEWATVIRALERGHQTVLLRKGGLREEEAFRIRHRAFFLFPTYIHQDPELLQPRWRDLLRETEAEEPPYNEIRITGYAELTDAFSMKDESVARALSDHYIWNERYVRLRFEFQPEWTLYALVLRAYRLPEPITLPFRTEYGGCRSWIDLEREFSPEDAVPALSDEKSQARSEKIREMIASGGPVSSVG
jgi:hypothetical protein